jgi:response regulator RpfG family c-di-GMP phosphodiesterase
VDDEPHMISALLRLLHKCGYEILTASSGHEALELLTCKEAQVIISDQCMPGMAGTDFLKRVKELYPRTVRIMLSGNADLERISMEVNKGVICKFIAKPWEDDELYSHIEEAFFQYEGFDRTNAISPPASV